MGGGGCAIGKERLEWGRGKARSTGRRGSSTRAGSRPNCRAWWRSAARARMPPMPPSCRGTDRGGDAAAGPAGVHEQHPRQPGRRQRADPVGGADRGGWADGHHVWAWRHGAGAGGPVAAGAGPVAADAGGGPLVWPGQCRQQGPARHQPAGAGACAGGAWGQAGLQRQADHRDRRGERVEGAERDRGRAQGAAGGRRAAGQRRAAQCGGGADDLDGDAGELPLRPEAGYPARAACIPATGAA